MRYKKELAQRPTLGDLQRYGVISCKVKNNLHQQLSREEPLSPTREPGIRQLADTFHLDARVHKSGFATS